MIYYWNSYSGVNAINIIHPYIQSENHEIQRDAPFVNLHNISIESYYNQEYYSIPELLSKNQFLKVNSEDLIHYPSPLKGFTSFSTRRDATTDEIHIFQLSDRGNIFYSTSLIKCHTKSVSITGTSIANTSTLKNIDSISNLNTSSNLHSMNTTANNSKIFNSSLEKELSPLSKSTSQSTLVNDDYSSFYSFLNHSLNTATDSSSQTLMVNDSDSVHEDKKSNDHISSLMAFDDEDEEEFSTLTEKMEENDIQNNDNPLLNHDNKITSLSSSSSSLSQSPFVKPLNQTDLIPPVTSSSLSSSQLPVSKDTTTETSSILNNIPINKTNIIDNEEDTTSKKLKFTASLSKNKKFINNESLERDRVAFSSLNYFSLYQYLTKDTMLPRDISSTHGFIQFFNRDVIQREVKDGVSLMKNNIMLKSL